MKEKIKNWLLGLFILILGVSWWFFMAIMVENSPWYLQFITTVLIAGIGMKIGKYFLNNTNL